MKAARTVPDLMAACRPGPRLVLMDVDSPQPPWIQAIEELRSDHELARVPVVGFYGHVRAEWAEEALAAGCTRVLARGASFRSCRRSSVVR